MSRPDAPGGDFPEGEGSRAAPVCSVCGSAGDAEGWCERCQRRVGTPAVVTMERRSSSKRPRRWRVPRRHIHALSALMSLVIPGAGQLYKGRIVTGTAWLLVVGAGYLFVGAPALLVHLMCVVTAGLATPIRPRPMVTRPASWSDR